MLCLCIHPRVYPVIQQLILTERAHGPGPGLGTCHLACPLMTSASREGKLGGCLGVRAVVSGSIEGIQRAWGGPGLPALPSRRPAHPQGLAPSPPPSPFMAEYGLLALQLRAEASAQGTAVMCPRSWPHRSSSDDEDGGLRLLDPFHSLFLPLGCSPAFLSPIG